MRTVPPKFVPDPSRSRSVLLPSLSMSVGIAVVTILGGCDDAGSPGVVPARLELPTPSDLDDYDAGVRIEILAELERL